MSARFGGRAAVAAKVTWEGGVMEALDYGIRATDMPEGDAELAAAWAALQTAWEISEKLAEAVITMLDDAAADAEDG